MRYTILMKLMTLRHDRISCSDLCQSCFFSDLLFRIETGSTILGPQYTKCHAVLGSCDLSCHHSRPLTRSARAKVDFWLHRINVENYMKRCKRDPVEPECQLFSHRKCGRSAVVGGEVTRTEGSVPFGVLWPERGGFHRRNHRFRH